MGKSTISIAIFHGYVSSPEGIYIYNNIPMLWIEDREHALSLCTETCLMAMNGCALSTAICELNGKLRGIHGYRFQIIYIYIIYIYIHIKYMIYMIYDIVYPCISYESSLFTLLQRVDARAKKVHLPHQPLGSEPVEQGWTFHR